MCFLLGWTTRTLLSYLRPTRASTPFTSWCSCKSPPPATATNVLPLPPLFQASPPKHCSTSRSSRGEKQSSLSNGIVSKRNFAREDSHVRLFGVFLPSVQNISQSTASFVASHFGSRTQIMFRLQLCFCSSVFNVHVLDVIISPIARLVTITVHIHFHTKANVLI